MSAARIFMDINLIYCRCCEGSTLKAFASACDAWPSAWGCEISH
jgi:hypothetical protein